MYHFKRFQRSKSLTQFSAAPKKSETSCSECMIARREGEGGSCPPPWPAKAGQKLYVFRLFWAKSRFLPPPAPPEKFVRRKGFEGSKLPLKIHQKVPMINKSACQAISSYLDRPRVTSAWAYMKVRIPRLIRRLRRCTWSRQKWRIRCKQTNYSEFHGFRFQVARQLFSSQLLPLLKRAPFFEATEAVAKIEPP